MKKNRLLLPIILLFTISSTGISQDKMESSWEISPEIGVITSYYGKTNRLFTNLTLIRPIFGLGVVKNINSNYKVKLQTDFVTIGRTSKYYNPFGGNPQLYQDDFILPFIQTDLTINSKLKFINLKFGSLSLGAGVFLGKILTPYITTKSLGNDSCKCENGTIVNYSSFNWGFLAAADLNLQSYLKLPISVNVKYNLGISDIRDKNTSPITGLTYPTKVTSNTLSIQLNYWFTLNKKKYGNKESFIRLGD